MNRKFKGITALTLSPLPTVGRFALPAGAAENDLTLPGDFLDHSFAGVHPTRNGHSSIARRSFPRWNGRTTARTLSLTSPASIRWTVFWSTA